MHIYFEINFGVGSTEQRPQSRTRSKAEGTPTSLRAVWAVERFDSRRFALSPA
jgi:hypothetical protein